MLTRATWGAAHLGVIELLVLEAGADCRMRDREKFMSDPAVDDAIGTLQRNARVFLDGFGWRPLSTEVDYTAARERTLTELFAAEAQAAGLL